MKKFLFIIPFIAMFSFPGIVKAEYYNLSPIYSEYALPNIAHVNAPVTKTQIYNGISMYKMPITYTDGGYRNVKRAGSIFQLANFQPGNYDLDFKIWIDYNYEVNYSFSQPIVSVNGKLCDTRPYTLTDSYSQATVGIYQFFYSVSCTNINFPNSNLDITTIFNLSQPSVGISAYAYDDKVAVFPSVKSSMSGIEDILQEGNKQAHEDAQSIKDSIEGDNLDTGSIEASQNDSIDSYKNAESSLNLDGADLSGINLGLNPTASSKIWYVLQEHLNVNAKLMSFLVSMLSIGLIKLFLGR